MFVSALQQKEDVIRKSIQYQPQNATNKFFEKDTNKPNRKTGVKMQKTAPSKPGERKLVEFQEVIREVLI